MMLSVSWNEKYNVQAGDMTIVYEQNRTTCTFLITDRSLYPYPDILCILFLIYQLEQDMYG